MLQCHQHEYPTDKPTWKPSLYSVLP
jgi:hypothetical protein